MGNHAVVFLACASALWACSFEAAPLGMAACVDGLAVTCECAAGGHGLQRCDRGQYGECSCGEATASAADDAANRFLSSGSAGSGGGAASSGRAGADGEGAGAASSTRADAGAVIAGAGSAHDAVDAGSRGEAGSGGGAAGASDAGHGGEAGAAGMDGEAGHGMDDAPAAPGTFYGFCGALGECAQGICTTVTNDDGTTTGYCAPLCSWGDATGNGGAAGDFSGGAIGACDQPETGDVQALCSPLTGTCALDTCMGGKRCPAGMECVEPRVLGQGTNVFDCRYPRRP